MDYIIRFKNRKSGAAIAKEHSMRLSDGSILLFSYGEAKTADKSVADIVKRELKNLFEVESFGDETAAVFVSDEAEGIVMEVPKPIVEKKKRRARKSKKK